MRIAVFATDDFIPPVGGAEVAMGEIIKHNPDIEFDLFVPKLIKGRSRIETVGNATIYRFGLGWPKFDKLWYVLAAPFYARFKHGRRAYASCWSMMASYGGFAGLIFTWLTPKIKMLLTLQEGDPPEYIIKRVGVFRPLFYRIFKRADEIQAISHFLAEWGKKMGFKSEPEVIPNGVDLARFSADVALETKHQIREGFGFLDSDIVLVTASRLVLKNGVKDIILALTHLPENYKALIIGFGEDEESLKSLAIEKGLSGRVVFAGRRDHEELPRLLKSSDIFIRPSLSEGLGNSFLEAMAAGIPIIGTPVGGIPDFLKDGETGVFCNPSDPESVAKAVKRIQDEPGLKQGLIERGRRLVMEGYSWDRVAVDMRQIFNDLAS
jgi:glycosyltransferase involved in cell wall biosynthesis